LWLLAEIDGRREQAIARAADDSSDDIRCQAVRMARRHRETLNQYLTKFIDDPSPAVRREAAIALREYDGQDAGERWARLAQQYDGQDRWYLEALGIAADLRWNECLDAWLQLVEDDWQSTAGVNLIWRSRAERTPSLLGQLITDLNTDPDTTIRLFRALEFQNHQQSSSVLSEMAQRAEALSAAGNPLPDSTLVEIACREPEFSSMKLPHLQAAVNGYLLGQASDTELVERVRHLKGAEYEPRLLSIILTSTDRNLASKATRVLLDWNVTELLEQQLAANEEVVQIAVLQALKDSGHSSARVILQSSFGDTKLSSLIRCEIVKALGGWPEGQQFILQHVIAGSLDDEFKFPAANVLLTSNDKAIRDQAAKFLALPISAANTPLPPMAELLRKRGDKSRGEAAFMKEGTCAKCHTVNGVGQEVGPDLSEIGGKLSTEAMFESILNPSAGISHNYEMHTVLTSDGRTMSGVLISQTEAEVTLKDKDAILQIIRTDDIDDMKKQSKSLMPDDLQKLLSEQQLIDIVEYMRSLKKKK
jgi:putative heme-binding domain-containing protein